MNTHRTIIAIACTTVLLGATACGVSDREFSQATSEMNQVFQQSDYNTPRTIAYTLEATRKDGPPITQEGVMVFEEFVCAGGEIGGGLSDLTGLGGSIQSISCGSDWEAPTDEITPNDYWDTDHSSLTFFMDTTTHKAERIHLYRALTLEGLEEFWITCDVTFDPSQSNNLSVAPSDCTIESYNESVEATNLDRITIQLDEMEYMSQP